MLLGISLERGFGIPSLASPGSGYLLDCFTDLVILAGCCGVRLWLTLKVELKR